MYMLSIQMRSLYTQTHETNERMRVSVTMEDYCRSTHQYQVSITSKSCSIATNLQKITRCVCVSCVCARGKTDVGAEGSEDKKKKASFAYYLC